MSNEPSFTPGLFAFLSDLAANNDREWFQTNKARYEAELKEPALAFIEDAAPLLESVSTHLVADPRPVGGSLFRIYRDTRFAKDKTPYKTHLGLYFRHARAKDAHAPGVYVHLEPGHCLIGAGAWRPEPQALRAIRERIVAEPERWRAVTRALQEEFELTGERLKRPPAGFDPQHPLIEDLKRKSFAAMSAVPDDVVTDGDLLALFEHRAHRARPLLAFLCDAVGVAF